MTEIPLISITQDENFDDDIDVDQNRPNINECHTDVEDIDNEHDSPMLKVTFEGEEAGGGGVTDMEDCLASEDDVDEPIKDTEISLNEFLDQGSIDESSKTGTQNMLRSKSLAKSPSPSAFRLNVATEAIGGGLTDVEDMQSSGEEIEEKYYSGDDKPIILEDTQGTDIQDSMSSHRKVSSINRTHQAAAYHSNSDSNSEPEHHGNGNKKRRPKRLTVKRSNKCEDAKSDVENIFLDDDKMCKQVRKARQFPVIDTPDVEVMAFDGSDMEENNEVKIPEINILFHSHHQQHKKCSSSSRKTTKSTPKSSPSLLLTLPKHSEDALTDIENLNSSDDEDTLNIQSKNFIPIAIMKSDALTDVEDMGDDDDDDDDEDMEVEEEKPEIVLPSPLREMTVLCENNDGAPRQETIPLPDTFLLSVQNMDIEKALTDIEDFSDEDDDDDNDDDEEKVEFELKNYFEMDGGIVESSDHSTDAALASPSSSKIPTIKKNYEIRQRRTKPKTASQPKSNFLNIETPATDALTDVEDMNIDLA